MARRHYRSWFDDPRPWPAVLLCNHCRRSVTGRWRGLCLRCLLELEKRVTKMFAARPRKAVAPEPDTLTSYEVGAGLEG